MYLADLDCAGGHKDPDYRKANLTPAEQAIAAQAFKTDKLGKVTLRSSKPKAASGAGKYVWRMIVFAIPKASGHHCLPVTADWDVQQSDIPAMFEYVIDPEWLTKQVSQTQKEEQETPGLFEKMNSYPWRSNTTPEYLDWSDYHTRRWPCERMRRYIKTLDVIADKVVATVPIKQQAGTMAWGRALGHTR